MASSGSLEQISRFILDYTHAQGTPTMRPLPEAERSERVFSAAFPISLMQPRLPAGGPRLSASDRGSVAYPWPAPRLAVRAS